MLALCCCCTIPRRFLSKVKVPRKKNLPKSVQNRLPNDLTMARILYAGILAMGFLITIVMRGRVFGLLDLLPGDIMYKYCDFMAENLQVQCDSYPLIYRLSFAHVIFFMMGILFATPYFPKGQWSNVVAAVLCYIQLNGFFWKYALIIILMIATQLIPDVFFAGYSYVALFFTGIYIITQLLVLIDWVFELNETLGSKNQNNEGPDRVTIYWILIIALSIIAILLTIGVYIANIILFGSYPTCHVNRLVATLPLVLGIISTIFSMVGGKGLLPGTLIGFFSVFMGWSAVLSNPTVECSRLSVTDNNQLASGVLPTITSIFQVILAAIALFRTAVWTSGGVRNALSIKNTNTVSPKKDTFNVYDDIKDDFDEESVEEAEQEGEGSSENEETSKTPNLQKEIVRDMWYSHFVFLGVSFFLAMTLSNWRIGYLGSHHHDHTNEGIETDGGPTSMWIKVASIIILNILFSWACVAKQIIGKWRHFD